jgi:hypothetical protein
MKLSDPEPKVVSRFEVTISPLERGDFVDVVVRAGQEEMNAFVDRLDMNARYQRLPLSNDQVLELARIVDIRPIEFADDGRWELLIRTPAAEVLKTDALGGSIKP